VGLLVIFGAGASFDSIDTTAVRITEPIWRPPLASQLFEDRPNFNLALRNYPYFTGRLGDLRRKAAAGSLNVEHELELTRATAEAYPGARVELAAIQFYLRQVLAECTTHWHENATGVTNYVDLLSRIDRWRHAKRERVMLVTFNYDTLLDRALAAFPISLDLTSIEGYVRRDDYKLVKPHGSVNWGRLLAGRSEPNMSSDQITRIMIERVAELDFTDEYVVSGLSVQWADNRLTYPAIAIPVEDKSEFACPQVHLNELVRWLTAWKERREQVDDVSHVLIVGWRASENHFLELLTDRLDNKRVLVVTEGAAAAESTAANLQQAGVRRDLILCSARQGFSDFLASTDLESFLGGGPA
jgi:hypothetical protein